MVRLIIILAQGVHQNPKCNPNPTWSVVTIVTTLFQTEALLVMVILARAPILTRISSQPNSNPEPRRIGLPSLVLSLSLSISMSRDMDMMLWHEKAGARYVYYVLSLVWPLELIHPLPLLA